MKAKITILVAIGILLTCCTPKAAAQEIDVVTEPPNNEVSVTQESAVTEIPSRIATDPPTEAPTGSPLACVTLLTPENGADLTVTGKVTFSWTPMGEAENYVLNFILPSGGTVSFETDQTFRDRYMEAFVPGGEYQWQVIVKGSDGSDICISEIATFDKPTYEKPKGGGSNGDNDGGAGQPTECPPDGCPPEEQ